MTQPQSSKTILVVDDQACIRQVLEIALRRAGFDVLVAASGLEALMVYQQHGSHISAVLLDVCMPDWDGPRTLAVLQLLNPRVCCCFMSADPHEYPEADLLQRGAVGFIRKPFRLTDITQALQEIVDRGPKERTMELQTA